MGAQVVVRGPRPCRTRVPDRHLLPDDLDQCDSPLELMFVNDCYPVGPWVTDHLHGEEVCPALRCLSVLVQLECEDIVPLVGELREEWGVSEEFDNDYI